MTEEALRYIQNINRAVTTTELYEEIDELESKEYTHNILEILDDQGYLKSEIITTDSDSLKQTVRYFPTTKFQKSKCSQLASEIF